MPNGSLLTTMQLFIAACLSGFFLLEISGCSDGTSSSSGSPAPTDAGPTTLAGADSDRNGVRDDIDAYIDTTYSDADTRSALRQYGRAVQAAMLDAGHAALSATHATERFRAIECLMARRPNDFPAVFTDLRARLLDTDARTRAYLQSDGQVKANTPPLLPADQWSLACTTF